MKGRLFLFWIAITLFGCYDEKNSDIVGCGKEYQKPEIVSCFDIIRSDDVRLSTLLINKCTGETWVAQYSETQGLESYKWLKINKTDRENNFVPIK